MDTFSRMHYTWTPFQVTTHKIKNARLQQGLCSSIHLTSSSLWKGNGRDKNSWWLGDWEVIQLKDHIVITRTILHHKSLRWTMARCARYSAPILSYLGEFGILYSVLNFK